jgi:hypothetical protein
VAAERYGVEAESLCGERNGGGLELRGRPVMKCHKVNYQIAASFAHKKVSRNFALELSRARNNDERSKAKHSE